MPEKDKILHSEITELIIKAFYHVYNTLGYGFLEKVYKRALAISLRKQGLVVDLEYPVAVFFEGELVGEYFADLRVAERVIIEAKTADGIDPAHEAQMLNYLKATDIEVGLLLNFGPKPEFRRKVFSNAHKNSKRIKE